VTCGGRAGADRHCCIIASLDEEEDFLYIGSAIPRARELRSRLRALLIQPSGGCNDDGNSADATLECVSDLAIYGGGDGSSNTAVTWAISPVGAESISAAGLYTAPSTVTAQTIVTVSATSVADTTRSATAMVTLSPSLCCYPGSPRRPLLRSSPQYPPRPKSATERKCFAGLGLGDAGEPSGTGCQLERHAGGGDCGRGGQ
jgi:hypothetical protein